MDASQKGREDKAGSADAKRRATAIIAAWACVGVAAVVAALSFLF
jgi:hypothetical protein